MRGRPRAHVRNGWMYAMVNLTREKKRLLGMSRDAQRAYDRLLSAGSSIIVCDDERHTRFEIRWRKEYFAHLCGWEYYRDAAKTIPAPRGLFYDCLKKGMDLSKYVAPTDRYNPSAGEKAEGRTVLEWTRRKNGVIRDALEFRDATKVVVSAKGSVLVFFGGSRWALGLGRSGAEWYYPKTLVAESVESDSVRRKNGVEWNISHIE